MVVNKLNQNPTKTEFIILQLIQNFRRHDEFQIEVGGAVIQPIELYSTQLVILYGSL